jgi:autotransporter-associated beta strand protein
MRGAFVVAGVAFSVLCVQAQTSYTWTNTAAGIQSWSGANWSPAVPANGGSADTVLNFGVNTGAYAANNDFSTTPFVLNGFIIGTGTVTLAGNALSLTNNGAILPAVTNASGSTATINNDITLATNALFSAVNSLSLNGRISGAGSLSKAGAGTLTLTNANTFSGGSLVSGGILSVSHAQALGTGPVTVAGGGLNKLYLNGGIAVLNPITLGSEAPVYADNMNSRSGENIVGNPLTVYQSSVRSEVGSTLRITNGIVGTAYVSFNSAGTIKVETRPVALTNQSVYFGGATVGTIQLNVGNNVFGAATLWGGVTLLLGLADALPTNVTLNANNAAGGKLNLNGFNQTIGKLDQNSTFPVTVTNSGVLSTFTVNQSASTAFSGLLSGNLSLVKTGSGTLTLTNANCFTGATVISNGVLRLGVAKALPPAGAIEVAGGVLDLGGFTVTNSAVTVRGGAVNNGVLSASAYTLSGANSIGVVLAGGGTLTKTGPGTSLLSVSPAYTGATDVQEGTLKLEYLPSGTVACYTFNDSGNLGLDISQQSNALKTVTGAPQHSVDGKFGGSLYLNGSSALGTLSGAFPSGVPTGAVPYTVAAYIRAETNSYVQGGWIGYGNGANGRCNNYRLGGSYTYIWNYWWNNDRGASIASGSFTDGWHSVIGTWDGATRQIYIDGVSRDSFATSGLDIGTNSFAVGRTLASEYFKGWVDNLLIANRALSPTEIASLHTFGIRDCNLPAGTALRVAAGAVMDLNSRSQTVAELSGSGVVTGGSLTVTGRLSAGDAAGAIGTIAVNSGLTLASGVTNAVDCSTTEADAVNVKGTLTLLGSGMVEVSLSDPRHPPAQVTLFTFNALASGENLTSWSVTGVPGGFRAKLSTQANSIVMTISRVGTLISVK